MTKNDPFSCEKARSKTLLFKKQTLKHRHTLTSYKIDLLKNDLKTAYLSDRKEREDFMLSRGENQDMEDNFRDLPKREP